MERRGAGREEKDVKRRGRKGRKKEENEEGKT